MNAPRDRQQREQQRAADEGDRNSSLPLGRSAAEWTTLIISLLVIAGLVGLVVVLSVTGGADPPRFAAAPALEDVRQHEAAYYLPIEVTNLSGLPAQDVRVVGELALLGAEPVTAEFTIDILAGGESRAGTMIFSDDPTAHAFSVRVESFR
jgi:uncharacterized protein (TIGR02588 family)